ncbi:Glycosyltransferase, GT2 family [Propionibacterium cyclohexanicum]|uniref:Glycosyltransferase, GT2 family n=1 Tax=Propionibacterium cyclohexanicum TaxID=64702 RepID=A0A1H9RQU3_9ACTN|nr:glycosyltransferase [Propionibacterium cyclohexanicum]SER74289.1 Glycosyltransferase, GT2 family [Propionibacterium cyclohexanicum]
MPGSPLIDDSVAAPGERVVAVVVAWNRRELLGQCLDALAAQRRPANAIVVVDNASTDGSADLAAARDVVDEVIAMPRNTGGAGGFTAGIAVAVVRQHADLVWIMDDDTIPGPGCLESLLDVRALYPGRLALLASRADWKDGREHPMNTPRSRLGASSAERSRAASLGCRPIRSSSFVSVLIDAMAIRAEGLPVADYFLWNDDFEYTARLLRHRRGLYVPAARARHLTKAFGDSSADPGPRFYREVRNKIWLFTHSQALNGWERVVYGASTLRRWARTVRASRERATLGSGLWRGLVDGLTARPRRNDEVLADCPVAHEIQELENPR